MATFAVTNATKSRIPRIPFEDMKDSILGNQYAVSLVFVGPTRAKKINETWRKKTYTPNVLAFEVSRDCGEIYICPTIAKREAPTYSHSEREHIGYLFIHALLHLKGHAHGDTMERAETRFMKRFGLM